MKNSILGEMGHRINKRRKEMGYTQEYLAEIINVSPNMISNLERGKKAIRPENLVAVAKALNVSCDYLLTGEHTKTDRENLFSEICRLSEKDYKLIENIVKYILENS